MGAFTALGFDHLLPIGYSYKTKILKNS